MVKGNALVAQLDRAGGFYPQGRGFESLRECQIMNENKKEGRILKAALKAARVLSKANRAAIKDPKMLCDCCMSEWTWNTMQEEKLCDECYEEKYVKTKVG